VLGSRLYRLLRREQPRTGHGNEQAVGPVDCRCVRASRGGLHHLAPEETEDPGLITGTDGTSATPQSRTGVRGNTVHLMVEKVLGVPTIAQQAIR